MVQLDVFEVSITPSPANNKVRLLSIKALEESRYSLPDGTTTDYEGLLDYTVARSEVERQKAVKSERPITIASFRC